MPNLIRRVFVALDKGGQPAEIDATHQELAVMIRATRRKAQTPASKPTAARAVAISSASTLPKAAAAHLGGDPSARKMREDRQKCDRVLQLQTPRLCEKCPSINGPAEKPERDRREENSSDFTRQTR